MPAPPSRTNDAVDLGHLLDDGRWTGYQKWLVLLRAVTIVFDGIDNQLLGVSIPTMMKEWSVPRGAFSPVISLGYFGMMLGGAAAGLAGDRFGRRTALLGSMIVFGTATLGAALVHSTGSLGVLRFLAGIGLGGAIPNAATLAAEYVPKAWRAIAVTLTTSACLSARQSQACWAARSTKRATSSRHGWNRRPVPRSPSLDR